MFFLSHRFQGATFGEEASTYSREWEDNGGEYYKHKSFSFRSSGRFFHLYLKSEELPPMYSGFTFLYSFRYVFSPPSERFGAAGPRERFGAAGRLGLEGPAGAPAAAAELRSPRLVTGRPASRRRRRFTRGRGRPQGGDHQSVPTVRRRPLPQHHQEVGRWLVSHGLVGPSAKFQIGSGLL